MLKSNYDFDKQILTLQDILDNNIPMAEAANICLQSIPQTYLSKAVQELKLEYEEHIKDDEKLTSVKTTLNLAAREHVTNIDELFMNLAEEINTYYNKKLLSPKKKIPYLKQCLICMQRVSNDNLGLKWHEQKCKRAQAQPEKSAPQRKNKKKQLDTKQKYQQRQHRLPDKASDLHCARSQSSQNRAKPLTKKERLASKKHNKHQEKLKKYLFQQKLDSKDEERESIFMQSQKSDQRSIIEKMAIKKEKQGQEKVKSDAKNDKAEADEDRSLQNEEQDYEFFS